MAKATNITAEAVFAAADQLIGDGQSPSLRAVRKLLGGGSFGTILPFLQSWKRARYAAEGGAGAVDLAPAVTSALDRLVAAAADVAEAVQAAQQAQAEEAERLAEEAARRATDGASEAELRAQVHALQKVAEDEIGKLRHERDVLLRELSAAKKELAELRSWRQRAVAHMKSLSARGVGQ